MANNQLLNQGKYNGVPVANNGGLQPGNKSGGKAWGILSANTLNLQGGLVRNLSPTAINSSGDLTVNEIVAGLITCNDGGGAQIVLNFPNGFAQALLTALGGATTATVPSILTVLPGQGLQVAVVNNKNSNSAVIFTTADANTVLYDSSLSVPANSTRVISLVYNALANPSLTVY